MSQDTTEKRAQYITRNNELSQEFSFAHPSTKCLINNIFNSHFTGSSLWNLFNNATEMLEKSWNVSHRIMFTLPSDTHKYLLEPISKTRHIKISLMKRYIRFSEMLATSKRKAVRNLYNNVRKDCQSNTGYNLRKIMLHNADLVDDFTKIPYYKLPDRESWRIQITQEISETKNWEDGDRKFYERRVSFNKRIRLLQLRLCVILYCKLSFN